MIYVPYVVVNSCITAPSLNSLLKASSALVELHGFSPQDPARAATNYLTPLYFYVCENLTLTEKEALGMARSAAESLAAYFAPFKTDSCRVLSAEVEKSRGLTVSYDIVIRIERKTPSGLIHFTDSNSYAGVVAVSE